VIGLPSLQAMDRAQETRIWLASEVMDMRCGFDRLAERVRAVIGEDPLSGHWFVFHSRRGERNRDDPGRHGFYSVPRHDRQRAIYRHV